jgi:allantoicase
MDFTTLPDLCDERLGAAVVGRNDEYFALADNLLKPEAPIWVADKFTKRGKWMDGWETRRRRSPGVDWCIVRLGAPGIVRGIVVDTAHFTGNFPKECWLEGCANDGYPSAEELAGAEWMPLGAKTGLSGDHKHLINVNQPARITHVRLTIAPDGGIARLHVHGEPVPDPRDIWGMPLDLAALEHGGVVVDCSDMYFSHRHNLNQPTAPASMADGWETRRRRGPGNDWVVVRLAEEGVLRIAEVDTRFFKGNAPRSFSLDGAATATSRSCCPRRICDPMSGTGSACPPTTRSPTSGSTSIPTEGSRDCACSGRCPIAAPRAWRCAGSTASLLAARRKSCSRSAGRRDGRTT